MRATIVIPAAAVALALAGAAATPVQAKGCLKGAVVGGVAGHLMHHHAILGAGIGCVIGHHEAAKHARERREQIRQDRNAARYSGER